MDNPWRSVSLSDYESHMKLNTVMQLQALNEMMKAQLNAYDVSSALILGIAGGNGLEHIDVNKYSVVYGVDVNPDYIQAVKERYAYLHGTLNCICTDLTEENVPLPGADLVIANLLIEYIGCKCFEQVVKRIKPQYVSCGIQIDNNDGFVSESPYTHSFDGLNSIHHQIDTVKLERCMHGIGYHKIISAEYPLPNGKKLVREDFSV